MKKCKKLFKSSSHFGSRKSTPKMGVGAVVIAKMNEAKRWCPFWGSGNDSQNGSRILCVLWKAWLGISTPKMKICNRKPLNSDLKTLLAKRVLSHAIQNTEMAFCCGDPRLGRPQLASLILEACPTTKSGVAVMRGFQALASWTISQQGLIV